MPINADLLEQIKKNDPTSKMLDLNKQGLNDNDIQQLVNALVTNTVLTSLHVEYNQIGVEGAKALAANSTLTELNVKSNEIGAEGAKALAANSTLTSLHVENNRIGNEGAKALVVNSTLTILEVARNQIGYEGEEQLKQAIARNNQQLISRRNQFIRTLMILAYDKANSASQSLWSRLPQELMVHIISLIDFRAGSIGKNPQQIKRCANFMFTHVTSLKGSIKEAIKTQQCVKTMEKHVQGKSHFYFFPPPPAPKAEEKALKGPTLKYSCQ